MTNSEMEAKRRIDEALRNIAFAQHLIGDATSRISRVVGVIENYEELSDLYDKMKTSWHNLNMQQHAPDVDLDSDTRHLFNK